MKRFGIFEFFHATNSIVFEVYMDIETRIIAKIQLKSFLSLHRFIVLNLSFYRCRFPNQSVFFLLSFYRFIVSLFYCFIVFFLVRNIEFILSFYRCKENIEFFYRFIVSSFYRFIVVNLSFYRCRPIVLSLRFIVLSL